MKTLLDFIERGKDVSLTKEEAVSFRSYVADGQIISEWLPWYTDYGKYSKELASL